MPNRKRPSRPYTLDPQTIATLNDFIAAGLYPSASRALDAAVAQLKRYHQRRDEFPPDPPDPGELDDDDDRRQK